MDVYLLSASGFTPFTLVIVQALRKPLQEVRERLKISDSTLRRLVRSGQVEAIQVGRQLRFEEREIKRFLDLRRRSRKGKRVS